MNSLRSKITGMASAAAAAAILVGLGAASGAQAAPLGYGTFLGTWGGNISNNEASRNHLEDLIRTKYTTDPNAQLPGVPPPLAPYSNLGIGDYQLNLVGSQAPGDFGDAVVAPERLFVDGTSTDGTWRYELDNDLLLDPGNEPVDFYLLTKWGNYFAVFYYGIVNPGDTGQWSTDWDTMNVAGVVNPFGTPVFGCNTGYLDANDGANCILTNFQSNPNIPVTDSDPTGDNGIAQGISHVDAYWPPIAQQTDVPEPATLGLLGAGLIGLGFAARRRRAS